jgi:hypothetical protein
MPRLPFSTIKRGGEGKKGDVLEVEEGLEKK